MLLSPTRTYVRALRCSLVLLGFFHLFTTFRKKQIAATRNLSLYPRLLQSGHVIIAAIVIDIVSVIIYYYYYCQSVIVIVAVIVMLSVSCIILYDEY